MTNEELYDRMRQQRMLREELRDKKKELEDMMRKEHSLKQNSRNQDTQSDVVSYSNKSDQLGLVLYCLVYFVYSYLIANWTHHHRHPKLVWRCSSVKWMGSV